MPSLIQSNYSALTLKRKVFCFELRCYHTKTSETKSPHNTTYGWVWIDSAGAKSQKMHQTRFRLPHQVANVSWFYLIWIPAEIVI